MSRSSRRGPWLPEEDGTLLHLVRTQGPNNWVRISQHMQHRSPKQCRERYHQNLKPTLNHEPISSEEGEQIERLVQEMGKRWAEIARRLGNRSDNAVKNWWNGSMNRRKRNPAPTAGASKSVGYRSQPVPASHSHRPMYHHDISSSPRDAFPPTYSLPSPFQRPGSTGSLPGYPKLNVESTYDTVPPTSRASHQNYAGPTPSYMAEDAPFEPKRRPVSPLFQTSQPTVPSLSRFRGSDVDTYRLPPIHYQEQPALSPAGTDDSRASSAQQAPSLISDNQSNCSISPKTIP